MTLVTSTPQSPVSEASRKDGDLIQSKGTRTKGIIDQGQSRRKNSSVLFYALGAFAGLDDAHPQE